MRRLLRWVGIAVGSLVAFAIIAYGVIYVMSERILRHKYDAPTVSVSIPADAESIAEGRRLATVLGCFGGCHGKQVEGVVMFDQPMIGRIVAPNLTASVHHYNDSQLLAIIKNGLRPDGISTFVMPSETFLNLTDEQVARIIAFLKSLPPVEGPGPDASLGPLGRLGVVTGQFKSSAQLHAVAVAPPTAGDEEGARGRLLAMTVCAHCHGTSLRGSSNPDFTSPTLQVVAAYSLESFTALMRTGVALGARQLHTMSPWAKAHLSQLTDSEISALFTYLHTLPAPAGG